MNKEILEAILTDAIQAPSGENTQPWRFEVTDDFRVHLYIIESRDESVYNVDNSAMYIACGALIENMRISASLYGHEAVYTLFPQKDNTTHVAEILFVLTHQDVDELYTYIQDRHSDRGAYVHTTLSSEFLSNLHAQSNLDLGVTVVTSTNSSDINLLSKAVSLNDFLLLHNKYSTKFLMEHTQWQQSVQGKGKTGLTLDSLGLSYLATFALRFVHVVSFVWLLGLWPIPRLVAYTARRKIRTASLVGVITTTGVSAENYIEVGRILERVWLLTTKEKKSFQVFGVPLLVNELRTHIHGKIFSDFEKREITTMNKDLERVFRGTDQTIVLAFRIGGTKIPAPRTLKMPPKIKYI
jgi:hypothetical protein